MGSRGARPIFRAPVLAAAEREGWGPRAGPASRRPELAAPRPRPGPGPLAQRPRTTPCPAPAGAHAPEARAGGSPSRRICPGAPGTLRAAPAGTPAPPRAPSLPGNPRDAPAGTPAPPASPARREPRLLTGRGRRGARPTRRARPGGGRPRAHNGARARPHPGSPGAGWRAAGPCRPTRSLLARRGSPWRPLADPLRLSLPARLLRGGGGGSSR